MLDFRFLRDLKNPQSANRTDHPKFAAVFLDHLVTAPFPLRERGHGPDRPGIQLLQQPGDVNIVGRAAEEAWDRSVLAPFAQEVRTETRYTCRRRDPLERRSCIYVRFFHFIRPFLV